MRLPAIVMVLLAVACGGGRVDTIRALPGDATRGETLYQQHCADCHGANGEGTQSGKSLHNEGAKDETIEVILDHASELRNYLFSETVPAFDDKLDDQQVADVVAFLKTL